MLELKDVSKVYVSSSGNTVALKKVNLVFGDTGLVFITGKSGSGKTTMLNVIGGLDGVDRGEILIDGKPFSSFTGSDYDSYRNTFIGFIFQEYNLLPEYTVKKNIFLANELQGNVASEERLLELMREMGIEGLENRKISELSGGQKQRVAIVRALIKNPKIIMADEPTGALDSVMGVQIIETLKELSKEKLVIVVSHDMELANKYADRIINIVDGVINTDRIINDVTIEENIYETEETLTIKSGSKLKEEELKVISKAVETQKKIKVSKDIKIRTKKDTPKIPTDHLDGSKVSLIKSKMKFKTLANLGLKSLFTKPARLIFTVLLSAVAFAVFGIFDTIAAFDQARIVNNLLKDEYYPSISISATDIKDGDHSFTTSLNQDMINEFSSKTGYNFRGVYGVGSSYRALNEEISDGEANFEIGMLSPNNASNIVGAGFYTRFVDGVVEFKNSEIDRINNIIDPNGFNYKIAHGAFPLIDSNTYNDGPVKVLISTYLADSLIHYDFKDQDGNKVTTREGLIGQLMDLQVVSSMGNSIAYYINGIVEMGEIPETFLELKNQYKTEIDPVTLADFKTFINSRLYSTIIAPEGYAEYARGLESINRQTNYYVGKYTHTISSEGSGKPVSWPGTEYAYLDSDFDSTKVVFFDYKRHGEYEDNVLPIKDGIKLAPNEVLVSPNVLKKLYDREIVEFGQKYKPNYSVYGEFDTHKKMLNSLDNTIQNKYDYAIMPIKELIQKLENPDRTIEKEITVKVKSEERYVQVAEVKFKVVGVYFGTDLDVTNVSNSFNNMVLSKEGFESLNITTTQGEYMRMVAPNAKKASARSALASQIVKKEGIKLNWYNNDILSIIDSSEEALQEFAGLFLIASIVLALFSIVMLFNYISTSIVSKKRSIGVLRGLGSNGRDILTMFLTESVVISIINSILAVIIAFFGCMFVNNYLKVEMHIPANFAIFTIRQILFIVIGAVVTAIVSSIIPILRIAKEKPVNLIAKSN